MTLGNMLISSDRDFNDFLTGKVRTVYADGSSGCISVEEAQGYIDSGKWAVIRK